ncbi:hypothetical protein HDU82_001630 [Entophlyctis luteolus]|nr:hypothetical protein HDU82_001630 [Entophlyctis luteolus]
MAYVVGVYTSADCSASSLQLVEVTTVTTAAACTELPCFSAEVSDYYYAATCRSTAVSAASLFPSSADAEVVSLYSDSLCTDLSISVGIIPNACFPTSTGSEKLTYSGSNVVLTQYTDSFCSVGATTTTIAANAACTSTGDGYYATTSGAGGSSNGDSGNGNSVTSIAVGTTSGSSSGSSGSSSGSSVTAASAILGIYSSPDCSANSIELVEVDPTNGESCTTVPCTASAVSGYYAAVTCSSTTVSAASLFPSSADAEIVSVYTDSSCTGLYISVGIIPNKCFPTDTGSEKLTYSGSNVVLTQYTDSLCSVGASTTSAAANAVCASVGGGFYASTSNSGSSSSNGSGSSASSSSVSAGVSTRTSSALGKSAVVSGIILAVFTALV